MGRSRRYEPDEAVARDYTPRRRRHYEDMNLQILMEEIDALDCGLELCDLPDELLDEFIDFEPLKQRRGW